MKPKGGLIAWSIRTFVPADYATEVTIFLLRLTPLWVIDLWMWLNEIRLRRERGPPGTLNPYKYGSIRQRAWRDGYWQCRRDVGYWAPATPNGESDAN